MLQFWQTQLDRKHDRERDEKISRSNNLINSMRIDVASFADEAKRLCDHLNAKSGASSDEQNTAHQIIEEYFQSDTFKRKVFIGTMDEHDNVVMLHDVLQLENVEDAPMASEQIREYRRKANS